MTNLPVILPRAEHHISRKQFDEMTLKVLYRLRGQNFKAYLVGGCVRDLLLHRTPKDFDVATDATPSQVKKLFRNCFLVGRRFRLAHIRFGSEVVEVATFRRHAHADDLPEDPADHHHFRENVFGTPEEDASRRDFTINALYYDIDSFAIIDYVGGLRDLSERRIRMIGDPMIRYQEDPVRMLRALEFAARLDFTLDPATYDGILHCAPLIATAAPARVREELQNLFRYGIAGAVLRSASATQLLTPLLGGYQADETTLRLLDASDQRTAQGEPAVSEGFALALLFASAFVQKSSKCQTLSEALPISSALLAGHCEHFHIACGIRHQARELLLALFRYLRGPGQRGEKRFLVHAAARPGFELFRLYLAASGAGDELLNRWQQHLERHRQPDAKLPDDAETPKGPRKRKRRRGGKKRLAAPAAE
ncbi:MAG: polynucleotide adenylyltransferase PcnB [Desulfuromonadales bacterium]|nr:polynucleotide adenylyltransferase PcnB [Desulfuromonadales bacterium]